MKLGAWMKFVEKEGTAAFLRVWDVEMMEKEEEEEDDVWEENKASSGEVTDSIAEGSFEASTEEVLKESKRVSMDGGLELCIAGERKKDRYG